MKNQFSAPLGLPLRTVATVSLGVLVSLAAPAAVELNGIAAKVNGKVVTKREVAFHLAPAIGLLRAKYPRRGEQYARELKKVQDEIMERLIENKLVLSKLEELNASIPEHVIDEEVNRIIREVFNGSEKEFRKNLEATRMTRRSFRKSQKEKILIQGFRQSQFKDVPPATPDEISARYRERRVELRDRSKDKITYQKIYIPAIDPENPANTPEQQLSHAEEIAGKIRGGADFGEMAKEYSAGAFAAEGGMWKDTPRLDLEAGFGDIVFESANGKIVGPLKDPRGFTIVKVISKKLGPSPPLNSKMRDRMRKEVEIEKRSDRYQDWLKLLKRSSMIERRM